LPTYIVTGSNTGIGRATAEALVATGGSVVLAARSEERTRPVIDALRSQHRDADVTFLSLDLGDLAHVRRAAETFLEWGRPLDVLINNAGLAGLRGLTTEGFEITVGTNHLGPFLFTSLVLPKLLEAPHGRVVNVASRAHMDVKAMDWGALARPPAGPRGLGAYAMSKLMNILYAKELARRLAATRVTTYSLHPGVVASDIWRALPRPMQWAMKLFMTTNEEGAKTAVYCATAPELVATSGRYYERCREAQPSALAMDESLARELYARTEEAIASVGQSITGTHHA
jgi:retinol dehydrogenase-12